MMPGAIVRAPSDLGIEYSNELTIIQLTPSATRSHAQKRRLFARMAGWLASAPGLRPDDVFINLVEVKKENWSSAEDRRNTPGAS
jgi:4-oxalocrotonate tautomerase